MNSVGLTSIRADSHLQPSGNLMRDHNVEIYGTVAALIQKVRLCFQKSHLDIFGHFPPVNKREWKLKERNVADFVTMFFIYFSFFIRDISILTTSRKTLFSLGHRLLSSQK